MMKKRRMGIEQLQPLEQQRPEQLLNCLMTVFGMDLGGIYSDLNSIGTWAHNQKSHQPMSLCLGLNYIDLYWTIDDSEKKVVGGEDAVEDDVVAVADAVESLNVVGMFEHES